MSARIDDDLLVSGHLTCQAFTPPPSSIGDAAVSSADPLGATKTVHQYSDTYTQKHGTATVAERRVIHFAFAAGTLYDFLAGVVVACVGGATITVDLYKNGATILTAAIVLDNTNVAFASEVAAFTAAPYVAGDVFEVVVTAAAGGGTIGQGLFVNLVTRENPV